MGKAKGCDKKTEPRKTVDKNGNTIVPKSGKRAPKMAEVVVVDTPTGMKKISGTQDRYWNKPNVVLGVALSPSILVTFTHTCGECTNRIDGFCTVKGEHRRRKATNCSNFVAKV